MVVLARGGEARGVRAALAAEIAYELDHADVHGGTLQSLAYADPELIDLAWPDLLAELAKRPSLPIRALGQVIEVLVKGRHARRGELTKLALRRFTDAVDLNEGAEYFVAVFSVDASAATAALSARLDSLGAEGQAELAQAVLPMVFGFGHDRRVIDPSQIDFDSLVRLVRVAFRTVKPEEDLEHPSGEAYGLNDRDYAEEARSAAFNQLVATPGAATYAVLQHLAREQGFPVRPARLRALAYERAARDAEAAAWPAGEAFAFEQNHETAPRTTRDLQALAGRKIADIQHDLLNEDFAQGATLSGNVQNWVADGCARCRALPRSRAWRGRRLATRSRAPPGKRLHPSAIAAHAPIQIVMTPAAKL